jgi:hypothetical protein
MSHPLPNIFATPPYDGNVRLYYSTLLLDAPGPYSDSPPIYHVSPYRLARPAADYDTVTSTDAFLIPLRPDRHHQHHEAHREILLVADDTTPQPPRRRRMDDYGGWDSAPHPSASPLAVTREVFFSGRWRYSGHGLLSMWCAIPIPVIELTGDFRGRWPRCAGRLNVLDGVHPGGPEVARAWQQRWNSDYWYADIARAFAEAEAAAAAEAEVPRLIPAPPLLSRPVTAASGGAASSRPATTTTTSRPTPSTAPAPLPAFVLEALVRDAVSRATACPITMEPLTDPSQVTVTACYHLFDATALAAWRASGENKCPVCRTALDEC